MSVPAARPVLILITGDPASGKSTLARACQLDFEFPILSRDIIKEIIFDSLEWSDRAWSKRVGSASFEIMFHCMRILLESQSSFILDCNLTSETARHTLREMVEEYTHTVIEVTCYAEPKITFHRFETRAASGGRHPGHQDLQNADEFRSRIGAHPTTPIIPQGHHLILDTGLKDESLTSNTAIQFIKRHAD